MREALRHFPLENQMSYASHASHTSHQQAEGKARSTTNKQKAKREAHRTHPPITTKQQNTTRKVNSNEQTEKKIQDEGNPFGNQRERRGPHMLNVRSAFS
ncbi:MAG: hypothetical protein J6N18_06995, partial [Kiritimatiellae bacterium]|nr:hypothetical protein [Kiritimatiellia bacterium]